MLAALRAFVLSLLRDEVLWCGRGPQAKACGSDGVTRNTQGFGLTRKNRANESSQSRWASAHRPSRYDLLEGEFLAEKTAISDKLDLQHCIRDRLQALSNVDMGGNVPAVDLSQDISCLESHLAGGTVG